MEIIVVAGQAHSVGKTTLASMIISNLGGSVGAIKCSIHANDDERMVTAKPDIIRQERTDTDILAASGAEQVVYLVSDAAHLKDSLGQAKSLIGEKDYLVIEGNSVLDYLTPDLTVYIKRDGVEVKPSAEKASARADLIVDSDELQTYTLQKEPKGTVPFTFQENRVPCYKAHLMAKMLGIPLKSLGQLMNEHKVKVKECQLGLF